MLHFIILTRLKSFVNSNEYVLISVFVSSFHWHGGYRLQQLDSDWSALAGYLARGAWVCDLRPAIIIDWAINNMNIAQLSKVTSPRDLRLCNLRLRPAITVDAKNYRLRYLQLGGILAIC